MTGAGTAEKMPGCVWTNESVTLLLSLYLREQQQDRPQKLKKKDVWRGICAELWSRGLLCSWQECDKKYRNLKQTFVRNLKQAGKKECRWIFFPLMLEINKHEPFVNEVVGNVLAKQSTASDDEDLPDEEDFVKCLQSTQAINLSQKRKSQPQCEENTGTTKRKRATRSPKKLHSPTTPEPEVIHQSTPFPSTNIPLDVRLLQMQSMQFAGQLTHLPHAFGSSFLQPPPDSCNDSIVSADEPMLDDDQSDGEQPPRWFNAFMAEFRKHEHRKLQQIADLCAEVRRTNDIEHQRNQILSEKNEILKHLNEYMLNK